MARPKSTSTTSVSTVKKVETEAVKNEKTVETDLFSDEVKENQNESENKSDENKADEVKENQNGNQKKDFTDAEIVKIYCKERAGKSINCNTLDIIKFDENGYADVKGINARYLLESNLGFSLA